VEEKEIFFLPGCTHFLNISPSPFFLPIPFFFFLYIDSPFLTMKPPVAPTATPPFDTALFVPGADLFPPGPTGSAPFLSFLNTPGATRIEIG